jgi:HEPN domain-containing protein
MKPITREWVEKAEADFATARRELRVRKEPNLDAVCFHCQQCVEKYLKGRLQQDRIVFAKTHNCERSSICCCRPTKLGLFWLLIF